MNLNRQKYPIRSRQRVLMLHRRRHQQFLIKQQETNFCQVQI